MWSAGLTCLAVVLKYSRSAESMSGFLSRLDCLTLSGRKGLETCYDTLRSMTFTPVLGADSNVQMSKSERRRENCRRFGEGCRTAALAEPGSSARRCSLHQVNWRTSADDPSRPSDTRWAERPLMLCYGQYSALAVTSSAILDVQLPALTRQVSDASVIRSADIEGSRREMRCVCGVSLLRFLSCATCLKFKSSTLEGSQEGRHSAKCNGPTVVARALNANKLIRVVTCIDDVQRKNGTAAHAINGCGLIIAIN